MSATRPGYYLVLEESKEDLHTVLKLARRAGLVLLDLNTPPGS